MSINLVALGKFSVTSEAHRADTTMYQDCITHLIYNENVRLMGLILSLQHIMSLCVHRLDTSSLSKFENPKFSQI